MVVLQIHHAQMLLDIRLPRAVGAESKIMRIRRSSLWYIWMVVSCD